MDRDKALAIELIQKKLNHETYLTYDEIAEITGYHTKYLFRLRKQIMNDNISLVHGNKGRKPFNAMTEEEKRKIQDLYRRSSVSIRKFCKFYGKRSYSCVYNIIHELDSENQK